MFYLVCHKSENHVSYVMPFKNVCELTRYQSFISVSENMLFVRGSSIGIIYTLVTENIYCKMIVQMFTNISTIYAVNCITSAAKLINQLRVSGIVSNQFLKPNTTIQKWYKKRWSSFCLLRNRFKFVCVHPKICHRLMTKRPLSTYIMI